jgi:hypothetical protein
MIACSVVFTFTLSLIHNVRGSDLSIFNHMFRLIQSNLFNIQAP